MNDFGNFLYQLRKERSMTQSDLAEILGVTNKAVSKWESGAAFPETAQLAPISDIFGVTVDELLKGRRNGQAPSAAPGAAETAVPYHEEEFSDDTEAMTPNQLLLTRLGLGFILAGVFAMLIMIFLEVAYPFYLSVLLGATAIGVAIFIIADSKKKAARLNVGDEQRNAFLVNATILALGVAVLIVSSLAIMFGNYFDVESKYYLVGFFLILLAGLLLVVFPALKTENILRISRANKIAQNVDPEQYKVYVRSKSRVKHLAGSILMPLAVIIYLVLGFVFNKWHPGWVVFPIAALLTGIISSVAERKY